MGKRIEQFKKNKLIKEFTSKQKTIILLLSEEYNKTRKKINDTAKIINERKKNWDLFKNVLHSINNYHLSYEKFVYRLPTKKRFLSEKFEFDGIICADCGDFLIVPRNTHHICRCSRKNYAPDCYLIYRDFR